MWFRILVLELGTFAIGTDSFVIAGILPDIAGDLPISLALARLAVTDDIPFHSVASRRLR